jgi:creatinine amidohydrolase/Fe(II)-dependent formamide hydrolase-like protein
MWKLIRLGQAERFGLSEEELYRQTDLQVAALGWLAQQASFAELATQHPHGVRVVDSVTLMRAPAAAMAALAGHFSIDLDAGAVASGPAFTRHSKDGRAFDAAARDAERSEGLARHAREVATVTEWALRMAEFARIPMILPQPLVG